jgi:sphingolipid delta-4 desaturase
MVCSTKGPMSYYADHTLELRKQLATEIPIDELRKLHEKRPLLHLAIAMAMLLTLAVSTVLIAHLEHWYLWLPLAFVSGFAIFDFTVLLHEVVHRAILRQHSERWYRAIGILYAVPSGISSTQFSRWHLDHHAELGSETADPKRHYLSPKRNERWFKLLYFTPVLFPIYFRAARAEGKSYPEGLQKTIALERNLTIAFHLILLGIVARVFGWEMAWKAYLVPYFFIFPIAFATNRIGQHYDINPGDPAQWATLVRGSWFWDVAYLYSGYHLEHHYFPGVPFYNLPRLQKMLLPFYERRGMRMHTYPQLLWGHLVLNRKPHTNWDEVAPQPAVAAGEQPMTSAGTRP